MTKKRVEELRDKMRQEWKENDRLFEAERAINQSYGFNRGIGAMLTIEEWNQVFTDEFNLEWAEYVSRVRMS